MGGFLLDLYFLHFLASLDIFTSTSNWFLVTLSSWVSQEAPDLFFISALKEVFSCWRQLWVPQSLHGVLSPGAAWTLSVVLWASYFWIWRVSSILLCSSQFQSPQTEDPAVTLCPEASLSYSCNCRTGSMLLNCSQPLGNAVSQHKL